VGGTLLLVWIIALISDWGSTKAEYRKAYEKGYNKGYEEESVKMERNMEKEWERLDTTESTDRNDTEAAAKSPARWWNLKRRTHRKQHSQAGKVWHEG
jgi:hypothetical protein